MQITPLGPTGAEVTGIDLSAAIDEETAQQLNAALVKHVALVFRDQDFNVPKYLTAGGVFGEPQMEPFYNKYGHPEDQHVTLVSNQEHDDEGNLVLHGRVWHTDDCDAPAPPNYTVLYAVTIPEKCGDTGILNTRDGYASLPADMRAKLDQMKMETVVSQGRARLQDSTKKHVYDDKTRFAKGGLHPLVRTHPEAGTQALYFHGLKSDTIQGMTPEETKALLLDILARIDKPAFVYRHKWRIGDMLIWDNRQALHQAFFDYDMSQLRLLHRLTLKGTAPFGPAMPLGREHSREADNTVA